MVNLCLVSPASINKCLKKIHFFFLAQQAFFLLVYANKSHDNLEVYDGNKTTQILHTKLEEAELIPILVQLTFGI